MTPREHLSAAKATLLKERDEISRLLAAAALSATLAVMHFELGEHERANAELEKGCDLEYEALAECEALGALSEALYPEATS